ncbi:MAG: hypothetical protein WBY44_27490 [Bryobacteraceae bacterium]|jgi:hypothetical protein
MNSYELLRPDGVGSGVWACGECQKPHLIAWRADKPVPDLNMKAAEECCAPHNCHYCGQPTERDSSVQYQRVHDSCLPKYEPPPPHPSMANPFARLLYEKMSAISEDFWCAGWLSGNEYALWDILHGDQHDYGFGVVAYEDLDELRILSEHANGWIWTGRGREHTPQLVTFTRWYALFAEASKAAGEVGAEQRDWTDLELPGESQ